MLKLNAASGAVDKGNSKMRSKEPIPKLKLPPFDEQHDKLDSFLERFERLALCQNYDRDSWALSLSPLLRGKALDTYTQLSVSDAMNYDKLKLALVKRYQMTEEGYRTSFVLVGQSVARHPVSSR